MSEPAIVDTHGIAREMEGKRLRIIFRDGEIAEIRLDLAMIYDCHESCNGFIYYLLATNRELKHGIKIGESALLGKFQDVVSVEQLGD
jgi:hypothetical protein